MRRLNRPAVTTSDVLAATAKHCYSKRKIMLEDPRVGAAVVTAESVYEQSMRMGNAHLVNASADIAGIIDRKEAKRVYDELKTTTVNGVTVREQLLNADGNVKCAYCGMDRANTLDHYLPKSQYVEYTFTPLNLVPSCSVCNSTAKKTYAPATAADVMFHPYFDEPNDAQWLMVSMIVNPGSGLVPSYTIQRPYSWGLAKFMRIKKAFDEFGLGKAYASDFLVTLNESRTMIKDLYDSCGPEEVRAHFSSIAIIAQPQNNWIQLGYLYLAGHLDVCQQVPDWFK